MAPGGIWVLHTSPQPSKCPLPIHFSAPMGSEPWEETLSAMASRAAQTGGCHEDTPWEATYLKAWS